MYSLRPEGDRLFDGVITAGPGIARLERSECLVEKAVDVREGEERLVVLKRHGA